MDDILISYQFQHIKNKYIGVSAKTPPLAAEIFRKIERCDFITRSHRSGYITTWLYFQLWVAFY